MKSFLTMIFVCFLLVSCRDKEYSFLEFPMEGGKSGHIGVPTGPYDAYFGYHLVESYTKSIDNSVKLMSVFSNDVNINGNSENWTYEFISTDKMILYYFSLKVNKIKLDSTSAVKVGNSIIADSWVSSEAAINEAEKNGGSAFRYAYPGCQISAALSEPVTPNSYPAWYITYSSPCETLYIMINASTGEFVMGRTNPTSPVSSVSTVKGNLQYTFSIPKTVYGIHDTLRASMNALNIGRVPESLSVNFGNLNWTLKNADGKTVMRGPHFISNYLILEVLDPQQWGLTGLINAPIADSSGNPVQVGSYVLNSGSLSLNLFIQ
jgi:hypothetical protein